jgi:hypothetical protein
MTGVVINLRLYPLNLIRVMPAEGVYGYFTPQKTIFNLIPHFSIPPCYTFKENKEEFFLDCAEERKESHGIKVSYALLPHTFLW